MAANAVTLRKAATLLAAFEQLWIQSSSAEDLSMRMVAESAPSSPSSRSVSLDGYVAPLDGNTDWVAAGRSEDGASWATFWPGAAGPFAKPMNEIPKAVFSGSLASADWGETTIATGDLAAASRGSSRSVRRASVTRRPRPARTDLPSTGHALIP